MLPILISMYAVSAPPVRHNSASRNGEATEVIRLANEICKDPPMYGLTLSAGGTISGKASVPALIRRLANASIAGSLTANVIYFKGIAQKDVGNAVTARNACAVDATRLLFQNMSFTSLGTGQRILLPADTRVAVQKVLQNKNQAVKGNQTINGNGNFAINGPTTLNFGGGSTPERLPNFIDLGAPCLQVSAVPDKVTALSSLSNTELKLIANELVRDLRHLSDQLSADRKAALGQTKMQVSKMLNEATDRAQQNYSSDFRERTNDLYTELVERLHGRYAMGPFDGLSVAGQAAYCGILSSKSGLMDFADYLESLAERL